jgi:hypothetical protein
VVSLREAAQDGTHHRLVPPDQAREGIAIVAGDDRENQL